MRKILLVDDDENLLGSMGEYLELALPVQCLRFRGLNQTVAHKTQILGTDIVVAILDINLGAGEPSGVDVYLWLREQGFRGKIIFMTGHAKDHPLVSKVAAIDGVSVFEKPMDVDHLVSLISEQCEQSKNGHSQAS